MQVRAWPGHTGGDVVLVEESRAAGRSGDAPIADVLSALKAQYSAGWEFTDGAATKSIRDVGAQLARK